MVGPGRENKDPHHGPGLGRLARAPTFDPSTRARATIPWNGSGFLGPPNKEGLRDIGTEIGTGEWGLTAF